VWRGRGGLVYLFFSFVFGFFVFGLIEETMQQGRIRSARKDRFVCDKRAFSNSRILIIDEQPQKNVILSRKFCVKQVMSRSKASCILETLYRLYRVPSRSRGLELRSRLSMDCANETDAIRIKDELSYQVGLKADEINEKQNKTLFPGRKDFVHQNRWM